MKDKRIAICKRELDVDVNTVFTEKSLRNDEVLTKSILDFSEKFEKNGGEVFRHEKNIIATNDGYYFAFYIDELMESTEQ